MFNLKHKKYLENERSYHSHFRYCETVNCVSQSIPSRGHRNSAKNDAELGKSDLANSENLVKLL